MIAIKLTAIRHGDIKQIEDCLCVGNVVHIKDEANPKASNGVAYLAECKGYKIGYVPELESVRGYYREARDDDARARIDLWGRSVKALRGQLDTDMGLHGSVCLSGRVHELLFENNYSYKNSWEVDQLPEEERSAWKLKQVSVAFEDIDLW